MRVAKGGVAAESRSAGGAPAESRIAGGAPAGGARAGGRSPLARRLLLGFVAVGLALTGTLAPARAQIALAAADGLALTTSATYTLIPARHVVRVSLDITARNNKPNVTAGGIITKYFYEGARVAIQAEATAVKATSGGAKVSATTTPGDGFRTLEVRFRSAVFYHQTATVRVTYDLPGGAPRSSSDIRVGSAFATFVAWAFGDTGSVRVVVPAGFEAETTGSDVAKSSSGGATILRATGISDIGDWYLLVNADRQSALTSKRLDLADGEHVVIRAWPEDGAWSDQVTRLLTTGLPKLVDSTGLDWPVAGDLSVFEVHTPLLEGYAGVFVESEDKIEISEDLDDLTILHEASHAWFNSDLFEGRWIDEGFADTYAAKALGAMGLDSPIPSSVSPTDASAVRLVDWVHPGRITDDTTNDREHYGYNAAWTVVGSLLANVGDDGMRDVLAAARAGTIPYIGVGPAEKVPGPNDWRRFLDLLDQVGHASAADDLFRRWVLTDALADQLDTRAAARTAYAALAATAGDWAAPWFVRRPMSDWNFPLATTRMTEATALLARRDQLAADAARLGVTLPTDLQTAYQGARDSLDDATAVADREAAALRALDTATTAVGAPRAPLVALGLIGTTPDVDLAAARSAVSAGEPGAEARATAVTAVIDGAVEIGRSRLIAAMAGLAGAVVLLVVAILLLRRRRRRRRLVAIEVGRAALAADAAAGSVVDEGTAVGIERSGAASSPGLGGDPPYATLADQSTRPPDGDPSAPPLPPELAGPADPIDPPPADPPPADPPPADRGDVS